MGTFDGVPILGDLEKGWNDNIAKPINDNVVQPYLDAWKTGFEESAKPIWERDSTPQEVKDIFNNTTGGRAVKLIPVIAVATAGVLVLSLLKN